MQSPNAPPSRAGAVAIYEQEKNAMTMYGGVHIHVKARTMQVPE